MLEKRLWPNILFILAGALTCILLWPMLLGSRDCSLKFSKLPSYTLNTHNQSHFSYPTHELPHWDYGHLINISFSFTMLNWACNDSNPLLLVLVHSSPRNNAKRRTIRETWGSNVDGVKLLFVLGSVKSDQLQNMLEEENRLHGDLIQGSFLDTYRNITYKHVMLFKYAIYHCPQAKYILKTDDDVFVNMPTMKTFLTVDLSPYGANNALLCTPRRHTKVLRSYRSKWRVSVSEYPKRKYPTYCPGWTLLYSPDVLFALYTEAQKAEDFFWIDDIHITGTLVEKTHILHTDIEKLVISKGDLWKIVHNVYYNASKPFLYGRSDLQEKEIRALWRFTSTHAPPRSVFKEYSDC